MDKNEELSDFPVVTPVAHAAEETPAIAIHTARDTAEIPPAMLAEAFGTLAGAINRLSDITEKSFEASQRVVEEPVEASTETAEEIAPEIEPPKPDRYIRRNGRRVKRG